MCSACFPRSVLPAGAPLSSTGSSEVSSPASSVLPERYDFLPSIPPRFVTFAWRYLSLHSLGSLPGGRVPRQGQELVSPVSPAGNFAEETTGSRKFLGNLDCSFAHVQSTPAGRMRQTVAAQPRGPWYVKSKGSREGTFDAQ
jgi:hypothetical protein